VRGAEPPTEPRTASQFFAQQPTNGNRYRWGVDLAWLIGPASVKFEYDQQIDQRKKLGPGGTDLDDVTGTGWYVTGTFLLTGENSVLNGPVIPRRPFSPLAGKLGPGAWELVMRYQQLKFTSDDPVDFFDGNINNGIPGGARNGENGAEAVTGESTGISTPESAPCSTGRNTGSTTAWGRRSAAARPRAAPAISSAATTATGKSRRDFSSGSDRPGAGAGSEHRGAQDLEPFAHSAATCTGAMPQISSAY
jgi:hypothetical protein